MIDAKIFRGNRDVLYYKDVKSTTDSYGDKEGDLVKLIRKQRPSLTGHIMRKGGLESIIATGKINDNRGKGKPGYKKKSWRV